MLLTVKSVKTIKSNQYPGDRTIMLRYKNNTLCCIYKKPYGYASDTFNNCYKTIKEAKQHMVKLCREGYFGEYFEE